MFFLLLLASPAAGAVRDASSCSQTDILAAVAVSVNGDSIRIPAGTCVWTSTITINKGVTLQGAGIGQTIIVDARVRSGGGSGGNLMTVNVLDGSIFRLTGTTWQSDGVQTLAFDGMIVLSGCSTTTANYRIDHNKFDQIRNVNLRFYGSLFGVTDHNTAIGYGGSAVFINANNLSWPRDGVTCTGRWGDGSWAYPLAPGTIKAHYVEDNSWTGSGASSAIVDSNNGARTVVRHNRLIFSTVGSHGTDSGQRLRSQRWLEIYDNSFNFPAGVAVPYVSWIRGGSGVVFNNKVYLDRRAGYNWLVYHKNLRSDDTSNRTFPPWESWTRRFPNCDGTAPWDGNTGDPSGKGYRCLDQPGSGTSVDFKDTDVPPNIPAQNTLEPIYVWDNLVNDVPENCGNHSWSCGSDGVVVAGRDIIYGTPRPGYVAFTYPHPLAASERVLLPPARLKVQ
jgi:hypothetical protein